MDITQFKMIRPARQHENDRTLRLTGVTKLAPVLDNWGRRAAEKSQEPVSVPDASDTRGIDDLLDEVNAPAAESVDPQDLTPQQIQASIFSVLTQLDVRFAESNDRLSGERLRDLVAKLLNQYHLDSIDWAERLGANADASTPFDVIQVLLRNAMRALLRQRSPNFELVTRLCRWALIASLLELWGQRLEELTADEVFDLLNRRPVVLGGVSTEELAPDAQVQLVREAKVADLQVVRREWAGYVAGEIANIRNVMSGESFGQSDKTMREIETTSENTSESRETTEREDQSKLDSELSQEVNSQLNITVNGYADASAEFKYPVVTARISAGMDAGLSLQRSERQASKIARETVSRALSRVDSMTRESRTRRELMRTEQGMTYALDNTAGDNVHGVYRWVDRVDTYQLFRYPDRFLLEFQIPEPAEFYRWRTSRTQSTVAAKDQPPAWTLVPNDITAARLIELASQYRASNLPAAPDPTISVLRTVSVDVSKESVPQADVVLWNPPAASKEVEIPVPTDYAASKVHYEGQGFPILTKWALPEGGNLPGYRAAFATVSIGDTSALYWNGGVSNKNTPSMRFLTTHGTQPDPGVVEEVQGELPPYGRALLSIGAGPGIEPDRQTVNINPPAINVVKLAISTVGVLSCTLTILVECVLTAEAHSAWQLGVYDALYAAWAQWKKTYDSALLRETLFGASTVADAGSSQRNEQIIREELKREVITWLLDAYDFSGRPALRPRPESGGIETDFADIDFDQARLDAPTIQFLEQAFEWNNMTYMFYPYYWAKRADWEVRSQIVANDPDFERFLRAGSARVIVPTRPGFDDAVRNWLLYRVPFVSGQLPSPDDPLYISIDKEIRELTSPWEGGVPGDTWQSRVGTTLLYLEKDGDLPFTNTEHQLPAPAGLPYTPKAMIEFP